MPQYYKGSMNDIWKITRFFAEKLHLNYENDEDNKEGIEFDLLTGEMFFVNEQGTKELITKFELEKENGS